MAMFRTLREQGSHNLFIYRIKLTANRILRHLAAENTVFNYLSYHFDHVSFP